MPISFNPRRIILAVLSAAGVFLSGCTPSGPRALIEGQQLVQHGDYARAIPLLKIACEGLPENAQAWNHLGLAYHGSGNFQEALSCYQHALTLDRNLAPVYFNLGNLYLENNQVPESIGNLSTFTALQPANPEGWIKLSAAQLRFHRPDDAEKSLAKAAALTPRDPEIQNNLGLAHLERRRPREALQSFARAVQLQTNYAPGVLNQAVVSHYHLGNKPAALNFYRRYLSLVPGKNPEIERVVQQLTDELAPQAAAPTNVALQPASATMLKTTQAVALAAPSSVPRTNPASAEMASTTNQLASAESATKPRGVVPNLVPLGGREKTPGFKSEPTKTNIPPSRPEMRKAPETVSVRDDVKVTAPPKQAEAARSKENPKPAILTQPAPPPPQKNEPAPEPPIQVAAVTEDPAILPTKDLASGTQLANAAASPPPIAEHPAEHPDSESRPLFAPRQPSQKSSIFDRLKPWTRKPGEPAPQKSTTSRSPFPSPPAAAPAEAAPVIQKPTTPRAAPRFPFRKNLTFTPGNRAGAYEFFSQAIRAHQEHRWAAAIEFYKKALALDPAFFEARYNLALAAYESGDLPLALASSEETVALKPGSIDARYNFALALRDANYFADAADQLRELLVDAPEEVRAHYTLANLYAQELDQPVLASRHYQKVLELDPRHPEAQRVRLWLAQHR